MRRTSRNLTMPALALAMIASGGAFVTLSRTADAAAPAIPSSFAFSGGGWGHGIGMSQVGAYGMASQGRKAADITRHFYTGTTVGSVNDNQELVVNLAHAVSSASFRTEALASGAGALEVTVGSTKVTGKAGQNWQVRISGSNKVQVLRAGTVVATGSSAVVRWSGTRAPGGTGARASVLNLVTGSTTFASTGHRYRYGTVTVRPRSGKLEILNTLRLGDEYLYGLAEVWSGWPAEALKAQVIAGRSYALAKFTQGIKTSCQCHLYDSVQDQNFIGYHKESSAHGDRWKAAVNATSTSASQGQAVLYKGKPIQAFYSASTGGRTQNNEDVWGGTPLPYLRSVADPWSTDKRYNPTNADWGPRIRTQKEVAGAFGLPNVVRLDLSSRYVSGSVRTAVAYSSTGKKATLTGASLTSRLSLTSRWVRKSESLVGGATRYSSSAALGRQAAPSGRTVVIASAAAKGWYTPLLAAPLARVRSAPVLLSPAKGLSPTVTSEVKRRKATTAYLVGGTSLLTPKVVSDLRSAGVKTVVRVGGGSRYKTSAAVARSMGRAKGTGVVVTGGGDYKATLLAAAPAARLGLPLLLVPKSGNVDSAVRSYVSGLAPSSSVIVGTTARVPAAAANVFPRVRRISGSNPSALASGVAAHFGPRVGYDRVVLVRTAFSQRASMVTAPSLGLLLVPANAKLSATSRAWIQRHPQIRSLVVPGIAGTVPLVARNAARLS